MTVEVGEGGDYEPDTVLHCGEPSPGDAVAVPDPLVAAEVLSLSTRAEDVIPTALEPDSRGIPKISRR